MSVIHKDLSLERWFKFSILEQLANVGSEVERTIKWKKKGELEYSKSSFDSALELLDFTRADPKNKKRLKELCYMRFFLVDHFMYDNEYETTDDYWSKLFFDYAYAAALARGR